MALFAWMAAEAALSNEALTVRAQTISPTDVGRLYWTVFMPRVDTDTTKIADIRTVDFRPAADRREWNTRGRLIPLITPELAVAEMIPIESYFTIDEKEVNDLQNRVAGNADLFRRLIGVRIPERTDRLVDANYRRLDIDAMAAWANGSIVVNHPQGAEPSMTVSLGFDVARYLDNTAWDLLGTDPYEKFIAFMENAVDLIGPTGGAVMRLALWNAIVGAAPEGVAAVPLTRSEALQRIRDVLGIANFNIVIIEDSHDVFTDGSGTYTRTKVWPVGKVAALPSGLRVGSTYFAPVARAYDFAGAAANRVDIRGNTVFSEVSGNGRELTVECQLNALPVPDEQLVYVADASATP